MNDKLSGTSAKNYNTMTMAPTSTSTNRTSAPSSPSSPRATSASRITDRHAVNAMAQHQNTKGSGTATSKTTPCTSSNSNKNDKNDNTVTLDFMLGGSLLDHNMPALLMPNPKALSRRHLKSAMTLSEWQDFVHDFETSMSWAQHWPKLFLAKSVVITSTLSLVAVVVLLISSTIFVRQQSMEKQAEWKHALYYHNATTHHTTTYYNTNHSTTHHAIIQGVVTSMTNHSNSTGDNHTTSTLGTYHPNQDIVHHRHNHNHHRPHPTTATRTTTTSSSSSILRLLLQDVLPDVCIVLWLLMALSLTISVVKVSRELLVSVEQICHVYTQRYKTYHGISFAICKKEISRASGTKAYTSTTPTAHRSKRYKTCLVITKRPEEPSAYYHNNNNNNPTHGTNVNHWYYYQSTNYQTNTNAYNNNNNNNNNNNGAPFFDVQPSTLLPPANSGTRFSNVHVPSTWTEKE